MASIAPCSRPAAAGGSARSRSRPCTDVRGHVSTPTPRSTTGCCSVTGSPDARAVTRRPSMPRSSATPFRRPSSRTLIAVTREGVAPFRRYHHLRKRALGLDTYGPFDATVPIVEYDRRYEYQEVLDWIVESVAPLGEDYQRRMREAFAGRWIDVYENAGQASAAPIRRRSTVCIRTCCSTTTTRSTRSSRWRTRWGTRCTRSWRTSTQPFVYSNYTIFVAEVPSTLSEALLLEYMLHAVHRSAGACGPAPARHRRNRGHVLHGR